MVFTYCCILLSIVSFTTGQSTIEAAGTGTDWMTKHNNLVQQTKTNNASVKAVFVGASSVEGWLLTPDWGLEVWNEYYKPRGAFAYGIGGDQTSNILYRISHNEFDGLSPKVVVIQIGSNNLAAGRTVEDTAAGFKAVVSALKTKMSSAKYILMAITPRNGTTLDTKVQSVNSLISDTPNVTFIDMSSLLRTSIGVQITSVFRSDLVHLNAKGYKIWHDQIATAFDAAMN